MAGKHVALERNLMPTRPSAVVPAGLAGNHTVVPLPFPAGKLKGISERLITSHHDNNYAAAVRNLNRVEQDLSHMTGETPPFLVAALHERELTFRNSKTLHEAYFANLGGDGRRSGAIEAALAAAYGTSARWEEHFRTTGLGLGGGSGWVILTLEIDTGALRTVGSGNHTQVLANALPLLIMDMYEHSYQMDFGAAVPRYIDAFFANVRWDEVNRRLERARAVVSSWSG
jgi:superoxide dismutase, Fe-Mn family